MKVLLEKEPCKGDVGKPSMGLHRPYRALLIADLHNLGLTPQAILCRPFRAPEKCNQNLLNKGCPGNEHLSAPIPEGARAVRPYESTTARVREADS